jgi:hypothetical protein
MVGIFPGDHRQVDGLPGTAPHRAAGLCRLVNVSLVLKEQQQSHIHQR